MQRNRRTETVDALNKHTTSQLDQVGDVTLVTDALTKVTSYALDALHRLVTTFETNGQKTTQVLDDPALERTVAEVLPIRTDTRLPLPGTIITRLHKGETLQVKVRDDGFEFEGEVFRSLSAVARKITGQHMNGFHFFRLGKEAV